MKDKYPEFREDPNPVARQERQVTALRKKLRKDYPAALAENLEIAIGNALKDAGPLPDIRLVEELTRQHLGGKPNVRLRER